jgi:predicted peroxiredoxin
MKKYQRATGLFYMGGLDRKKTEEARQKLFDEVEMYVDEAGVQLDNVRIEDIVLP